MTKRKAALLAGSAAVVLSVLAASPGARAATTSDAGKEDDRTRIRKVHVHEIEDLDRPFLGVQVTEEVDLDEGGARIERVVPDSPADESGLEEGDVIVGVGGRTVRGPRGLAEALRSHDPGDPVKVEIVRDGDRDSVRVELGERPLRQRYAYAWRSLPHRPLLGVELVDATPDLREHLGGERDRGVLVGRVVPGSAATEGGVQVGDLIVRVDGEDIEDPGDLIDSIQDHAGDAVTIGLVRNGRTIETKVELPDREVERAPAH